MVPPFILAKLDGALFAWAVEEIPKVSGNHLSFSIG
jgi:hypothetical protein